MNTPATEYTNFVKLRDALSHQHNFQLLGKGHIGEGVYGRVYEAKCKEEGEHKEKSFAIKILDYVESEGSKKKIYQEREIEILIRLELSEDSNIIKYFNCWKMQVGYEQKLCIQMELCSTDLSSFVYDNKMGGPKIIQAQGRPRFYEHVFRQILIGLVVMKRSGWVHRDIHPGNILIALPNPTQIRDIHVKISDFGQARYLGMKIKFSPSTWLVDPTFENVTPKNIGLYSAPELEKNNYDFKVDLYSAGMVLYYISRYLEDKKALFDELEDLRNDNLDVHKCIHHKDDIHLSQLIKDLLQKDPKKRPSAQKALKSYMFSTEVTDSTDASPESLGSYLSDSRHAVQMNFIARKENEQAGRLCVLKQLNLSALKAEVERRTGVRACQQVLQRHFVMRNGKEIPLKIDDDEDVRLIYTHFVEGRDILIDVIENKVTQGSNGLTARSSPEDVNMVSVS
ncbi:DNA damage response protein kinase DUN1-like [Dendronephthya gigantea]|uniref:DNA damage response protein kinase DUN1-like n=1 Tax=Dendronephthya gigantea TaxID=151771 RepID=UPI00106933A7|nr:DNA damage response protein kinase DUN1-like [Dendronephthya gigantea]